MADNIAVTEGSGKDVATDDVGGKQYQRMKIDLGTDGAAAPALAGAGAVATGVQRMTLASDDPAVALLTTIDSDTNTIQTDTTSIDGKITACNTGAVVLTTGSAAIGKLAANSGVDIGDVDVTSIIPLTGATNLGKARDVALGANDVGVMALAVRDDSLTTLTPADGDFVPLRVNSTGSLHVTGGGGGTEYTEDVATANPIVGSAVMVERDDALGGLTPAAGDWASLRCDANGALWTHDDALDAALSGSELQVDIVAALPAGTNEIGKLAAGTAGIGKLTANSGVDIGDVDVTSIIPGTAATNLGKARDSALGATDTGVMALAVRDDSLTTLTPADGDYVPMRVNSTGALHVTGGGGGTEYTEDVATANPIVGSAVMFERDDIIAGLTPAEGDWASMRCSAEGALWVQDFNSDAIAASLAIIDDWDDTDKCKVIIQTGSNAIGKLAANTGVDIGDVDVTTVIPGVGATNLGKAEDAAHSSGDVGVAAMTVRANTATSLSGADNDYQPLITDTNGRLHVLDANSAAMLTALQILDDWDDSDYCNVNLNIAGTDVTGGAGAVGATTQRVTLASDDPAVAALEIIDDWDAVHAGAASSDGPQVMGAGYSTGLPTDVGADGDAARICTDRFGRVLAGLMPQAFQATFNSADATSAAPVKVKTASRKMYILSLVVSTDTEMDVQFQDDTGPTVLVENIYLAARGGWQATWPPEAPLIVNTNEDFDIIASTAGNVSVTITGYLAV